MFSRIHPALQLEFDFVQPLPFRVLGRYFVHREGPNQSEPRIAIEQAALGARRIKFPNLIACLGPILENLVTVRKAFWHVEGPIIVRAKLDGNVVQVCRALRAQVNNDVENCSASASHKLGFGGWRILKMHSAQSALSLVEGDVGLRYNWFQQVILEFPLAERSRKKSAIILPALDVDYEGAFKLGLSENHVGL
jgi:hypothetical protein